MKDQEIQIGCSYRVTKGEESRIVTIKDKAELIASLCLNDKGRIEPIALDADELARLGAEKDENNSRHTIQLNKDYKLELTCNGFSNHEDGEYWISITGYYQQVTFTKRYVHQTQQLFQALTGENLPYNEK